MRAEQRSHHPTVVNAVEWCRALVTVAMFQIYNERVDDLLEPDNDIQLHDLAKKNLTCGSTALRGLEDRRVDCLDDFENVLRMGYSNVSPGKSRHTLVRITVSVPDQITPFAVPGWKSELNLVDSSTSESVG